MPKNNKILRLILGDQLNPCHSWFQQVRSDVTYLFMEVGSETGYAKHHIQKICAFFGAMRAFSNMLRKNGHWVLYISLDDPKNLHAFSENVQQLVHKDGYTRFEYMLPDEIRVDRHLAELEKALGIPIHTADSEHFLTQRHELASFFSGKKRFSMESFYRHLRKRFGILMEKGKPDGGLWNFDRQNRSRYDGKTKIPQWTGRGNDVTAIVKMLDRMHVETIGEIAPSNLMWPVTREQSLKCLDDFCRERLPHFGVYQDAMTEKSPILFHSLLSFALNTKMLHPMEVIRCAVNARRQDSDRYPIAQIEGFIRQILGWREYMRGVYWARMPGFSKENYFSHHRPLPDFYWTGKTAMRCMKSVIEQSLQMAWAHHIQRLMITGNFALLAGIHPDEVDAWYLGIYVDAVEWVELPNTRGMSQFADGGIVATKPYVSSANYIRKMSDYCSGCEYDAALRYGDRSCPFNSLYWDFYHRHRPLLQANPRIGMAYRTWDRMGEAKRRSILAQAEKYKNNLNAL